jgi:F-type H+-transporting ATPase subunit delta
MISGSLSRRYAKALLELGLAGHNYELLAAELDRVVATVESSKELKSALESPVFPMSQRKAILAEVLQRLGVPTVLAQFCQLVLDRNRFAAMGSIARELRTQVDQAAGRVRATVTSAVAVPEAELGRIRRSLEQKTGKQVVVETRQDASLIGGVVVKVGDVVYDGSIKSQLQRMQEQLLSD